MTDKPICAELLTFASVSVSNTFILSVVLGMVQLLLKAAKTITRIYFPGCFRGGGSEA